MSILPASAMNFIREACEHVFGVREVTARAEDVSQFAVRALISERVPTLTTGSCGSACLKWTHFWRESERERDKERQREREKEEEREEGRGQQRYLKES